VDEVKVNYTAFLIYIPLLGLALGYTFWIKRRAAQAAVSSRPAQIAFFERTGYCYADRPNMPPEVQADRALQLGQELSALGKQQVLGKDYEHETHMVRNYHGLVIHYRNGFGFKKELTKSTTYRWANFTGDLLQPPRVALHIAHKSLGSVMKAVGEAFSNTTRVFRPRCAQRIATGIPAVDSEFVVYADDPAAAAYVLSTNPALVDLLSGWAELDVAITREGVFFNDPTEKNTTAAMGGMLGNMALGFDIGKRLELMTPVHDRVADLMLTLARATA
jgi:hypothetical protein